MRKWLLVVFVALLAILIDQVTKIWIVNHVVMGQTIAIFEVLQPYLQITRTTNTGFAFGLASGSSSMILVLSSLITLGLFWMCAQSDESERLQHFGLAMLIGGAIGNIIDRIRLGHVVDFVHIKIPGIIENVSNFADHFVVLGVIVLLIDSVLFEQRKPKDIESEAEASAVASGED